MLKSLATGSSSKLIFTGYQNAIRHRRTFRIHSRSSYSSKMHDTNKKTFNTPHPSKDPPENYNPLCVKHKALDVPDFIPAAVFRPFSSDSETLGPGADKNGCYKNPEYYSYHRYSFIALQLVCLKLSAQSKNKSNIRCLYESDDSKEEKCISDEDKN